MPNDIQLQSDDILCKAYISKAGTIPLHSKNNLWGFKEFPKNATIKVTQSPDTLRTAAPTFDGTPVVVGHYPNLQTILGDPERHIKGIVKGCWFDDRNDCLSAYLEIWDDAIQGIQDGSCKQCSIGFESPKYRIKDDSLELMQILGCYVALVPTAAWGSQCRVFLPGEMQDARQRVKELTSTSPKLKQLLGKYLQ